MVNRTKREKNDIEGKGPLSIYATFLALKFIEVAVEYCCAARDIIVEFILLTMGIVYLLCQNFLP